MERTALLSQGTSQHCSIRGICLVLATCYYTLRTPTRHRSRPRCILILPFSFPKDIKKNVVSNFIMASGRVSLVGVRFWLVTYSAAVFDLTSKNVGIWNIPLNPISWKRVWGDFEMQPVICKTVEWGKFSSDHWSLACHLAGFWILEPFTTPFGS